MSTAATRCSSPRTSTCRLGFPAATNEYTADVKSWLGLANAYWDICTIHGLTPYLGAGIGFSTLTVDGLKDVNVPNNSVFFGADTHQDQLRLGAVRGPSFDVTPQFVVDLGYRYANLGDAESGVVTAYDSRGSYSGRPHPRHHLERSAARRSLQAAA